MVYCANGCEETDDDFNAEALVCEGCGDVIPFVFGPEQEAEVARLMEQGEHEEAIRLLTDLWLESTDLDIEDERSMVRTAEVLRQIFASGEHPRAHFEWLAWSVFDGNGVDEGVVEACIEIAKTAGDRAWMDDVICRIPSYHNRDGWTARIDRHFD